VNRSISLVALILFGAVTHLPAPIVEESPAPAPKTKRAEQKSSSEPASGTKQSPLAPFVGVWRGTVRVTSSSDTAASNNSSTNSGTFEVLRDGNVRWSTLANGQYRYRAKASLSSDNHELRWSYQNFDEKGNVQWAFSLRLADPKTANYQGSGSLTSPFVSATMTASGMLTKR